MTCMFGSSLFCGVQMDPLALVPCHVHSLVRYTPWREAFFAAPGLLRSAFADSCTPASSLWAWVALFGAGSFLAGLLLGCCCRRRRDCIVVPLNIAEENSVAIQVTPSVTSTATGSGSFYPATLGDCVSRVKALKALPDSPAPIQHDGEVAERRLRLRGLQRARGALA